MDDGDELVQRARERVGRLLKSKWTLEQLIGIGGMAAVYAAVHRNGKRVAVKMLHPELSLISSLRTRFLREGYVANAVGHRSVVTVDDDDIAEDGSAFLVMELLDGCTLDAKAEKNGGTLPLADVLRYAVELLDVLVAAHERGVVHRDIKPENLFLTNDGALKVLDFGIARVRELSGSASSTRSGAVMGTPAFMAPEQARGRSDEIGPHTDLWAVGATMFTLISGEWVHDAPTVNEVLASSVMNPARSIVSVCPTVPPQVAAIVDRALQREVSARYESARAMQLAIKDVQSSLSPGAEGAARPRFSVGERGDSSGRLVVAPVAYAATTADMPRKLGAGEPALKPTRRSTFFVFGGLASVTLLVGAFVAVRMSATPTSAAEDAPAESQQASARSNDAIIIQPVSASSQGPATAVPVSASSATASASVPDLAKSAPLLRPTGAIVVHPPISATATSTAGLYDKRH